LNNGSAYIGAPDKGSDVGLHLLFAHKRRLEPHDLAAWPAEQHIAAAEQVLGPSGVKHDT
jgi:hypothetical protein